MAPRDGQAGQRSRRRGRLERRGLRKKRKQLPGGAAYQESARPGRDTSVRGYARPMCGRGAPPPCKRWRRVVTLRPATLINRLSFAILIFTTAACNSSSWSAPLDHRAPSATSPPPSGRPARLPPKGPPAGPSAQALDSTPTSTTPGIDTGRLRPSRFAIRTSGTVTVRAQAEVRSGTGRAGGLAMTVVGLPGCVDVSHGVFERCRRPLTRCRRSGLVGGLAGASRWAIVRLAQSRLARWTAMP